MFEVKKGVACFLIPKGKSWSHNSVVEYVTSMDNIFEKHELCVDPTGISKYANGPLDKTVGGMWAKNGFYGFTRGGNSLLVGASNVNYLD
jgi:hypothetical protein